MIIGRLIENEKNKVAAISHLISPYDIYYRHRCYQRFSNCGEGPHWWGVRSLGGLCSVCYLFVFPLSYIHKHRKMLLLCLFFLYTSLFVLYMFTSHFILSHELSLPHTLSPSLPPSLSECGLFNSRLRVAERVVSFWLEHELCPRTSLLFTHWGHGLCGCRYRSYLSVVLCSLGMDRNSPSLHCHGNTTHGTKRMTHHLTAGSCFFCLFSDEICFPVHGMMLLTDFRLYWDQCWLQEKLKTLVQVVDFWSCRILCYSEFFNRWCFALFQGGSIKMLTITSFFLLWLNFSLIVNTRIQVVNLTHTCRHMSSD